MPGTATGNQSGTLEEEERRQRWVGLGEGTEREQACISQLGQLEQRTAT